MKTSMPLMVLAAMLFVMPGASSAQVRPEVDIVDFSWRKAPVKHKSSSDSMMSPEMRISQIDVQIALENQKKYRDSATIQRLLEERKSLSLLQIRDRYNSANRSNRAYEYTFKFKNHSKRDVSGLVWLYKFIDPVTGKEVARQRFVSKERVGSGKQRELTSYTDFGPPTVVNADAPNGVAKVWRETVMIQRIEFSDGSRWAQTGP